MQSEDTVDTYPVTGTTMTYIASNNSLKVEHSGGEHTYTSGSVLRISINGADEYEVEDPGEDISNYNYNVSLSHSNLDCFVIKQRGSARSGIGINDFRGFKIVQTWDIDCEIGLELSDGEIKVGFDDNTSPCYTEAQETAATCD